MSFYLQKTWYKKNFSQLSLDELYSIIRLRVNVFMIEQSCLYPELDDLDKDPQTLHLFTKEGIEESQNEVIAYSRVLPMNTRYANSICIGRVVVDSKFRNEGLGHQLIQKSLEVCTEDFKNISIKISAQAHLESFYQQHCFSRISNIYLEDDIPHITMKHINPPSLKKT